SRSGDVWGSGNTSGSSRHACRESVAGSIGAAGWYTVKSAYTVLPLASMQTRKYSCPGVGLNTSELPTPIVGFASEYWQRTEPEPLGVELLAADVLVPIDGSVEPPPEADTSPPASARDGSKTSALMTIAAVTLATRMTPLPR